MKEIKVWVVEEEEIGKSELGSSKESRSLDEWKSLSSPSERVGEKDSNFDGEKVDEVILLAGCTSWRASFVLVVIVVVVLLLLLLVVVMGRLEDEDDNFVGEEFCSCSRAFKSNLLDGTEEGGISSIIVGCFFLKFCFFLKRKEGNIC